MEPEHLKQKNIDRCITQEGWEVHKYNNLIH